MGGFTDGMKRLLTGLSALEFFLFVGAVIGFCVIETAGDQKERKWR